MALKYFLRLFGSGRLPPEGQRYIESDRNSFVAEALIGSITLRNFRSPGRYSLWKRQWFLGSIAVTKQGMVAFRYRWKIVDLPFDDPRIRAVSFSVATPDVLSIAYDASLFQPSWSGKIAIQFRASEAQKLLTLITSGIANCCPT